MKNKFSCPLMLVCLILLSTCKKDSPPSQPVQQVTQKGYDLEQGLVNILGGCCGATPEHIEHVAKAVAGIKPRAIPERPKALLLSGLEPFELK